jgi:hypothetical protein
VDKTTNNLGKILSIDESRGIIKYVIVKKYNNKIVVMKVNNWTGIYS